MLVLMGNDRGRGISTYGKETAIVKVDFTSFLLGPWHSLWDLSCQTFAWPQPKEGFHEQFGRIEELNRKGKVQVNKWQKRKLKRKKKEDLAKTTYLKMSLQHIRNRKKSCVIIATNDAITQRELTQLKRKTLPTIPYLVVLNHPDQLKDEMSFLTLLFVWTEIPCSVQVINKETSILHLQWSILLAVCLITCQTHVCKAGANKRSAVQCLTLKPNKRTKKGKK